MLSHAITPSKHAQSSHIPPGQSQSQEIVDVPDQLSHDAPVLFITCAIRDWTLRLYRNVAHGLRRCMGVSWPIGAPAYDHGHAMSMIKDR
jgi:hypothetical protein